MADIRKAVNEVSEEVLMLRRDIHAHPELGFEEHRTAELIEKYLQKLGISTNRFAKTGVVGLIEGTQKDQVLMLRADMDALPIEEENDLSYRSQNPGIMHACGHDAHTAMLLGAAKILNQMKSQLSGSIKLVFQPNEECAGALRMIEEGVLDNPRVDTVFGLHVWSPLPTGFFGISAGAVMAGLEIFKITVKGVGGHTGYPESAVDPIIAAADIILSAQRIQTREISLMKPTVIVFGNVHGGTKANIIPDTVMLEGSIRTLYQVGSEDNPSKRLQDLAEKVSAAHGCSCNFESYKENIPLVNNPELSMFASEVAVSITNDQHKVIPYSCMASEDFSEFTARVPGVFVFLGIGSESKGTHYPHHNCRFNIDEDILPVGVEMYVRYAWQLLNNRGVLAAQ
ncbi:MAG: amidohydrolase [Bacillota bacterium]|nr:amidohydrolase [Bacillota bacterium]